MAWHQVDEAVNWLVATLGDDLRQQIDAAAEVFGAMNDDERHRHRARHTELSLALASLRRGGSRRVDGLAAHRGALALFLHDG